MSQDTGKPLHAKRLVFRIYFSSSIMELQKCSLACPYREVLEKSQVIDRGLCYSKLWILSYLSLDVWWNDDHLHRWEGGLGSVVVCSSDRLVFQDSRLELNWNTARRPSAQLWWGWWRYIHEQQYGYRHYSAPLTDSSDEVYCNSAAQTWIFSVFWPTDPWSRALGSTIVLRKH